MNKLVDFDHLPEVAYYKRNFLNSALREARKLKETTIYSKLIYIIAATGTLVLQKQATRTNKLEYDLMGIIPMTGNKFINWDWVT